MLIGSMFCIVYIYIRIYFRIIWVTTSGGSGLSANLDFLGSSSLISAYLHKTSDPTSSQPSLPGHVISTLYTCLSRLLENSYGLQTQFTLLTRWRASALAACVSLYVAYSVSNSVPCQLQSSPLDPVLASTLQYLCDPHPNMYFNVTKIPR